MERGADLEQLAAQLLQDGVGAGALLKPGHRRLEVARRRQPVRA